MGNFVFKDSSGQWQPIESAMAPIGRLTWMAPIGRLTWEVARDEKWGHGRICAALDAGAIHPAEVPSIDQSLEPRQETLLSGVHWTCECRKCVDAMAKTMAQAAEIRANFARRAEAVARQPGFSMNLGPANLDRRIKKLWLDQSFILDLFRKSDLPNRIVLPDVKGMPADAKVIDVRYDEFSRAWILLIQSAEFEEVPMGQQAPGFGGDAGVEWRSFPQPRVDPEPLFDCMQRLKHIIERSVTSHVVFDEATGNVEYRETRAFNAGKVTISGVSKLAAEQSTANKCTCPREVWLYQGCKCGAMNG